MALGLIQAIVDGLLMGGVYALLALGLSLIFGVMKITNFAHGALMMLGMYVTYALCTATGLVPYVVLPLTMAIMFLIGFVVQRFLINKIISAPSHNQLLLTLGVTMITENAVLAIWSPNFHSVTVPGFDVALSLMGLSFSKARLLAFVVAVFVACLVYLLLGFTVWGKAIRAIAQDRVGATFVGIRTKRVFAVAFGLGIMCAGIAGALITPSYYLTPTVGGVFLMKCFVVAILGGMGNIWGGVVAGLIVGVCESLSGLLLGGTWNEMVIYAVFVLTLLFKPTGIFGSKRLAHV